MKNILGVHERVYPMPGIVVYLHILPYLHFPRISVRVYVHFTHGHTTCLCTCLYA